jgi:hypothetical protein
MLERVATDRTVRHDREDARAQVSRLVASIPQVGVSYTAMAQCLGINHQRVSKMADVNYPTVNMTIADAVCLPPLARIVVARALAKLCGCTLVADIDVDTADADMRAIADAHRESAEAISAAMMAIADGKATADEARAVEREVEQAIVSLYRMLSVARQWVASRGKVFAR